MLNNHSLFQNHTNDPIYIYIDVVRFGFSTDCVVLFFNLFSLMRSFNRISRSPRCRRRYSLLSPIVICLLFRYFSMTGISVGPRICYSRAELVSLWSPDHYIARNARKNLFYHQLWCPRFRYVDAGIDPRRCHKFGGPSKHFVSARRSTLGIGVVNARSLNQKHASIHDCISEFNLDVLAVTETWHSSDQDLVLRRAVRVVIHVWLLLGLRVTSLSRARRLLMFGVVGLL